MPLYKVKKVKNIMYYLCDKKGALRGTFFLESLAENKRCLLLRQRFTQFPSV
ncbi:hypothetical protein J2Z66_006738 [Paenibacillus eucommiae]|uniref:Uncharacterized protein n=1 Tax=Paenibacillus eucommiae TaxID=1355755 RepID=A0ABS4J7M4_9BACL|nr:hypothetical protein [Paenibacillus eucommiae]